jgi:hypothetical protein
MYMLIEASEKSQNEWKVERTEMGELMVGG